MQGGASWFCPQSSQTAKIFPWSFLLPSGRFGGRVLAAGDADGRSGWYRRRVRWPHSCRDLPAHIAHRLREGPALKARDVAPGHESSRTLDWLVERLAQQPVFVFLGRPFRDFEIAA